MIEKLAGLIPKSVLSESGSVFYSGRAAFNSPSSLYILGLNPGGSPETQANETVEWHTNRVLNEMPPEWSAYSDESWKGSPPGTCGLQPRVLHMLRRLNLNPRHVPASNVVFIRSAREKEISSRFDQLAEETWSFHQSVISQLEVKVILCFGQSAGSWIAKRVGANQRLGQYVENNNRRWRSVALSNKAGLAVVVATHPSIADWTSPASDPTPLVRHALQLV